MDIHRIRDALTKLRFNPKWINNEITEALVAAWCIEFLRLRRVGGFRPVEVITISLLMVVVRHLIQQAGKRGRSAEHGEIVLSDRTTQMGFMGYRRGAHGARRGARWTRRRSSSEYPY